ncbi:MAG TPA: DCC1-like thiol-disulfide oxidoreductase family protein [Solirubrobacteraceae bacterium]|nr:DCC1-like thiol-disulfide oxidoreductase family protein [Solirubrobacteraceae bacterium]
MARDSERLLVLYDEECGFCAWCMAWLLRADRGRRLAPVAIDSERGARLLADMPQGERLASWHVCDDSGLLASGGAGVAHVLARLPGGAPAAALARRLPRGSERAYAWVAAHRSCFGRLLPRASKAHAHALIASRMH